MGKRHRKADRAVTHEEVAKYSATETLFKSNLFQLQEQELLREVCPFSAAEPPNLSGLEQGVRALRDELSALPAAELSWQRPAASGRAASASHPHLAHLRLHNESVQLSWTPPEKIDLVGSYLLRTCTAPELNIDVAIQLPTACLQQKDYLDHRYADKRLLYLSHLAHVLRAHAAAAGDGAAGDEAVGDEAAGKKSQKKRKASDAAAPTAGRPTNSAVAAVRFACMPHAQSRGWPVLEVALSSSTSSSSSWIVRLIPCLAPDAFPAVKLRPQRCNLRALGASPSSSYNNLLRIEASYAPTMAWLHGVYARDGHGALREATVLLKVWARQRFGGEGGAPTGFQLSLLLVHLLAERKINVAMSSYQILRVALGHLRNTDLSAHPIVLPPMTRAAAAAAAPRHPRRG